MSYVPPIDPDENNISNGPPENYSNRSGGYNVSQCFQKVIAYNVKNAHGGGTFKR